MLKIRNQPSVFVFLTAIMVFSASPASAAYHPPPKACDNDGCYEPNPMGGWGLRPKRTYSLAYNGDAVCPVIVKALNDTLAMDPKKAIARVTRPVPRHPDLEDGGGEPDSPHPTYLAQNPLFSDPMFLRWNYVGGQIMKSISNAPRDTFGSYNATGKTFDRWLIAPFRNDGKPYLLVYIGSMMGEDFKLSPDLLDVPSDELKTTDWSIADNYRGYTFMHMHWPDWPADAETTNYLYVLEDIYPRFENKPTDYSAGGKLFLPKLSPEVQNYHSKSPWAGFGRYINLVQFTLISGKIYTILVNTAHDVMIVDNASKAPGDDLCYIQSTISDSLKQAEDKAQ